MLGRQRHDDGGALRRAGRNGWQMTAVAMGAAGVLTFAAACGSGSGADPGPGGGTVPGSGSGVDQGVGSGATLTVTFDVEGEITLKGTAVDNVLPSTNGQMVETCAQYAQGGPKNNGKRYFILPLSLGGDLNGKRVSLNVSVRNYTGPSNYTQENLTAEGVSFGVQVEDKPYVAQGDANGSIVSTDAEGGGSFYFEKLAYSTGGDTSPGISGQISWTCKD